MVLAAIESVDGYRLEAGRTTPPVLLLRARPTQEDPPENQAKVSTAQTIDDEVHGRVERDEDVANIGQVPSVVLEMLELCEAEVQRPYEMRQEGSHVAQDADRYYGDDNDCYTPVALIG
jgi:hypothetical protein